MSGVDHVRFYSSKWRSGCLMLSLEAEGLYIRIASFRWDAGIRVPSDKKKAALLLRINFNKYTKVLDELFAANLVIDNGDGLVIERAEIEYTAAEEAIREKSRRVSKSNGNGTAGASDQGREGPSGDNPVGDTQQPAPQVTPQLTGLVTPQVTPPACAENSEENQRPSIDKDYRDGKEGDESRECDWKIIRAKLIEAAGDALASEAVAPGLANLSTPLWWIDQGADFERDILPAVAETSRKSKRKIVTWDYFTNPVTMAKAKREQRLPEVKAEIAAAVATTGKPRKTFATYDALMQQVTGAPAS